MGTHGMVATTHYLASQAGLHALKGGGNVVDAGATMWFCHVVLEPHLVGIAGEVPILLYWAEEEKVIVVNGQGTAPKAATIGWFRDHGYELIPEDGFLPATVPGSFDAWLTLLDQYGTFSLGKVVEPAMDMAGGGFPLYGHLARSIASDGKRFRNEWPSSAEIYLPGGALPRIGQVLRNPDLGRTLKAIADSEGRGAGGSRSAGINSAREFFYRGPIAETIIEFMSEFKCRDVYGQDHNGLMTMDDLASFRARLEEPVTTNYRGVDVFKCGPWTQGPVFLQQLNLLEGFDLRDMGHNSGEYLHNYVECSKLAYADREQYYADPDFFEVPLSKLLSKEYAARRRQLVDPNRASMELRPGDAPPIKLEDFGDVVRPEGDTVHLEAVDSPGNMISATPSGAWIRTSPVVPGLGFPMGTRGQMFHLDPNHAERLEPEKRPSTTLTPSLAMKDGRPYMVFGTPGGDQQDQWTLQLFLNHVDFGMNVQLAIDMPMVHSTHFPASFWPHDAHPGVLHVEGRIPGESIKVLKQRGHKVIVDGPWSYGRCCAIRYDPETGVMFGGASPRTGTPYAMGW